MRHPKHQTCPVPLAYSPFTRVNLQSCCSALFSFSNTGNGKAIGLKISRCCKGCTVLSCGDVGLGDARPPGKFAPGFPSTAPVLQLYHSRAPDPAPGTSISLYIIRLPLCQAVSGAKCGSGCLASLCWDSTACPESTNKPGWI